jgi:transposase
MVFKWLRDPRYAGGAEAVEFLPVEMTAAGDASVIESQAADYCRRPTLPSPPKLEERPGIIEIDLACGARVRVDAHVDDRALARALARALCILRTTG